MNAITLQNCLDAASYFLGESGTPTTETVKRTEFANEAKEYVRNVRNWSWEKKDGTAINLVAGTTSYALPSDFKARTAMEWGKVTDSTGASTYLVPVKEADYNSAVLNQTADPLYWVKGNNVDGYTLLINPVPSANVTNGLSFRYYSAEPDFVATTDTTRIPKRELIAWYIAAKVLYGYREQAQYQLAMQEFQNALMDIAAADQKADPYVNEQLQNFRQFNGRSVNFKTYF